MRLLLALAVATALLLALPGSDSCTAWGNRPGETVHSCHQ